LVAAAQCAPRLTVMSGLGGATADRDARERVTATIPCPVLVGRAAELDALTAAFERARAGRGEVVYVTGEAGIGKSRLVHEIAAVAEGAGALVLRGRAVPGSGAAAFRPLTEALAPVAGPLEPSADLAPWLPALATIVPAASPPAHHADVTAPIRGEAVVRLLASVCDPAGALVVLEDLHWADPETIAVVEHLTDNLGRAPALCVVTVRDGEGGAAGDLVRRVAATRTALVLHLGRLNDAQVGAMVYSCAGASDPGALARIVSVADGVPFLIEELLVSPGLPASFAATVESRLSALSDTERRVLVTAAALGRHFDWRVLPAASGVPHDDVVDALDRGVAAQLLSVHGDGFRFRHALTAEAVFQSVAPPRREAFASAALAALDDAASDVTADLAERAGQPERAGRLHLALGEEALERGALHTAVVALERATALLAEGSERDTARERLVEALSLAGRADDAAAVGRDLVARLPAPRAAGVHLRLAGVAIATSRWAAARAHLEAARGLVGPGAQTAELTVREAELAYETGDTARAETAAHEALTVAAPAGLAAIECEALQILGRCARRASLEQAERWFRRALDVAEAHDLALWRLRALHEIGTIRLLDRSDVSALVEAQELAEAIGAMATMAILDIEIAAGCNSANDLPASIDHGLRAVQRGSELGMDVVVAYGWLHVATGARLTGDAERADDAAAAARAAAPGNRDVDGLLVGGEMLAALVGGDVGRALAMAERFTDLLRGSTTAPPAHHRAAWPLLLAVAGRGDEAEAAVAELEAAGIGVNRGARAWLLHTRAVLAGRADPQRAHDLAVAADADLIGLPLWRELGRRLVADAAGAAGWDVPADWRSAAPARTMRGPWTAFGVTPREADVLALVVEGLSNREIADRLYLSVRPVEKHVAALLRKTATRTRTQLARVATT
jgi:DNA-binding CsgD family transcriptional regulator